MENQTQDILIRVHTMLVALKDAIEKMDTKHNYIEEKYISEFHIALDKLAGLDINLAEYYIPDSQLNPIVTSRTPESRSSPSVPTYSKEKYADKSFVLMRLNAVQGYFEVIISDEPRKIGFNTPN
ncbi:MAG: hypothetical protein PHQ86_01725 [Dehalococcoidales bacterium]|nr:hypothetical protein [Dehalococcoidales bacterium]